MNGQNTQKDSEVRVGTVIGITLALLAIGLMVAAMTMSSGCEPMETDDDGGELMDDDSEMDGDDAYLPPAGIALMPDNPNNDISIVTGPGIIDIIDPASCDKVAHIAGTWYTDSSLTMTVTATPATGNTCKVNFSGAAAFAGDFFGLTLPMVREGSCGWLIVTMLTSGNLIQSGYA